MIDDLENKSWINHNSLIEMYKNYQVSLLINKKERSNDMQELKALLSQINAEIVVTQRDPNSSVFISLRIVGESGDMGNSVLESNFSKLDTLKQNPIFRKYGIKFKDKAGIERTVAFNQFQLIKGHWQKWSGGTFWSPNQLRMVVSPNRLEFQIVELEKVNSAVDNKVEVNEFNSEIL